MASNITSELLSAIALIEKDASSPSLREAATPTGPRRRSSRLPSSCSASFSLALAVAGARSTTESISRDGNNDNADDSDSSPHKGSASTLEPRAASDAATDGASLAGSLQQTPCTPQVRTARQPRLASAGGSTSVRRGRGLSPAVVDRFTSRVVDTIGFGSRSADARRPPEGSVSAAAVVSGSSRQLSSGARRLSHPALAVLDAGGEPSAGDPAQGQGQARIGPGRYFSDAALAGPTVNGRQAMRTHTPHEASSASVSRSATLAASSSSVGDRLGAATLGVVSDAAGPQQLDGDQLTSRLAAYAAQRARHAQLLIAAQAAQVQVQVQAKSSHQVAGPDGDATKQRIASSPPVDGSARSANADAGQERELPAGALASGAEHPPLTAHDRITHSVGLASTSATQAAHLAMDSRDEAEPRLASVTLTPAAGSEYFAAKSPRSPDSAVAAATSKQSGLAAFLRAPRMPRALVSTAPAANTVPAQSQPVTTLALPSPREAGVENDDGLAVKPAVAALAADVGRQLTRRRPSIDIDVETPAGDCTSAAAASSVVAATSNAVDSSQTGSAASSSQSRLRDARLPLPQFSSAARERTADPAIRRASAALAAASDAVALVRASRAAMLALIESHPAADELPRQSQGAAVVQPRAAAGLFQGSLPLGVAGIVQSTRSPQAVMESQSAGTAVQPSASATSAHPPSKHAVAPPLRAARHTLADLSSLTALASRAHDMASATARAAAAAERTQMDDTAQSLDRAGESITPATAVTSVITTMDVAVESGMGRQRGQPPPPPPPLPVHSRRSGRAALEEPLAGSTQEKESPNVTNPIPVGLVESGAQPAPATAANVFQATQPLPALPAPRVYADEREAQILAFSLAEPASRPLLEGSAPESEAAIAGVRTDADEAAGTHEGTSSAHADVTVPAQGPSAVDSSYDVTGQGSAATSDADSLLDPGIGAAGTFAHAATGIDSAGDLSPSGETLAAEIQLEKGATGVQPVVQPSVDSGDPPVSLLAASPSPSDGAASRSPSPSRRLRGDREWIRHKSSSALSPVGNGPDKASTPRSGYVSDTVAVLETSASFAAASAAPSPVGPVRMQDTFAAGTQSEPTAQDIGSGAVESTGDHHDEGGQQAAGSAHAELPSVLPEAATPADASLALIAAVNAQQPVAHADIPASADATSSLVTEEKDSTPANVTNASRIVHARTGAVRFSLAPRQASHYHGNGSGDGESNGAAGIDGIDDDGGEGSGAADCGDETPASLPFASEDGPRAAAAARAARRRGKRPASSSTAAELGSVMSMIEVLEAALALPDPQVAAASAASAAATQPAAHEAEREPTAPSAHVSGAADKTVSPTRTAEQKQNADILDGARADNARAAQMLAVPAAAVKEVDSAAAGAPVSASDTQPQLSAQEHKQPEELSSAVSSRDSDAELAARLERLLGLASAAGSGSGSGVKGDVAAGAAGVALTAPDSPSHSRSSTGAGAPAQAGVNVDADADAQAEAEAEARVALELSLLTEALAAELGVASSSPPALTVGSADGSANAPGAVDEEELANDSAYVPGAEDDEELAHVAQREGADRYRLSPGVRLAALGASRRLQEQQGHDSSQNEAHEGSMAFDSGSFAAETHDGARIAARYSSDSPFEPSPPDPRASSRMQFLRLSEDVVTATPPSPALRLSESASPGQLERAGLEERRVRSALDVVRSRSAYVPAALSMSARSRSARSAEAAAAAEEAAEAAAWMESQERLAALAEAQAYADAHCVPTSQRQRYLQPTAQSRNQGRSRSQPRAASSAASAFRLSYPPPSGAAHPDPWRLHSEIGHEVDAASELQAASAAHAQWLGSRETYFDDTSPMRYLPPQEMYAGRMAEVGTVQLANGVSLRPRRALSQPRARAAVHPAARAAWNGTGRSAAPGAVSLPQPAAGVRGAGTGMFSAMVAAERSAADSQAAALSELQSLRRQQLTLERRLAAAAGTSTSTSVRPSSATRAGSTGRSKAPLAGNIAAMHSMPRRPSASSVAPPASNVFTGMPMRTPPHQQPQQQAFDWDGSAASGWRIGGESPVSAAAASDSNASNASGAPDAAGRPASASAADTSSSAASIRAPDAGHGLGHGIGHGRQHSEAGRAPPASSTFPSAVGTAVLQPSSRAPAAAPSTTTASARPSPRGQLEAELADVLRRHGLMPGPEVSAASASSFPVSAAADTALRGLSQAATGSGGGGAAPSSRSPSVPPRKPHSHVQAQAQSRVSPASAGLQSSPRIGAWLVGPSASAAALSSGSGLAAGRSTSVPPERSTAASAAAAAGHLHTAAASSTGTVSVQGVARAASASRQRPATVDRGHSESEPWVRDPQAMSLQAFLSMSSHLVSPPPARMTVGAGIEAAGRADSE